MQTTQKKFWIHQISAFLLAVLCSVLFWRMFSDFKLFYFPKLSCGVGFCIVETEAGLQPFLPQFFFTITFAFYVLILFTIEKFCLNEEKFLSRQPYEFWIPGIIAIIFLSAAWEGVLRARSFVEYDLALLNEPYEVQYKKEYPDTYHYAQAVKANFSENYLEAALISDFDFSEGEGMSVHRALAYFLYPINVRFHLSKGAPKVLLFFGKTDAVNYVPPGYRVLAEFSPYNLIAVKE